MRKCVIHIGMSKTGTSSLQEFLKCNSSYFSSLGYGVVSQPRLVPSCVLEADDSVSIFKSLGLTSVSDIKCYQEEKRDQLERKFLSHNKVVISSEWLCGFVKKDIQNLKDYLKNYFNDFQVVVYFRRQDRYAVSLYGLRLIVGESPLSPLNLTPAYKRRMDYLKVLEDWGDVFGHDTLCPRIFKKEEFVGSGLYQDFLSACQIELSEKLKIPENSNESVSREAQEFLFQFNSKEKRFVGGLPNKQRELVVRLLKENFKGKGRLPSKAQAKEFMGDYNEMNSHICSKYFPRRESLFDDDYSDYPDGDQGMVVDEDGVIEVYEFIVSRLAELGGSQ